MLCIVIIGFTVATSYLQNNFHRENADTTSIWKFTRAKINERLSLRPVYDLLMKCIEKSKAYKKCNQVFGSWYNFLGSNI